MSLEDRREFVALGGKCLFDCKHCYTFCDGYKSQSQMTIEGVVESLENKKFDIIYVSGHRENFIDPDEGLLLCERLFEKYNVDLLITTRNIFNKNQLLRLENLYRLMKKNQKDLFFCSSIPATASYRKLETSSVIPTPYERMDFLKVVFELGIFTFLTIRPLCPNEFIPIEEPLEIVDKCHPFSSAIISSGIVVNKSILDRLETFPVYTSDGEKPLMGCLKNDILVEYPNVENELEMIRNRCKKYEKKLFIHSCPAIEYVKNRSNP